MPRFGVARARSLLLAILSVEIAVLVITGIALFFLYRPSMSQAWTDVFAESTDPGVRVAHALRRIHRLSSYLAVATAVATGVVVALRARTALRVATGAGIAGTTVAATFTGLLLPWDQLALWAVTVGTDMNGYQPLFDDTVRFVLIGGAEVSRGTMIRWLLVHMLVLGPGLAGLVALAWSHQRSQSEGA